MNQKIIPYTPKLELKKRLIKGGYFFGIRQLLVHGLNVIGTIFLARKLMPADFGIFAIFMSIYAFSFFLTNLGLSQSLIQQEEVPTKNQLNSIFTLQTIFSFFLIIIFWFITPLLLEFYDLNLNYRWSVFFVSCNIIFANFNSTVFNLNERELNFKYSALTEIVQAFAYNFTAILLATFSYGLHSLVFSFFVKNCIGSVFLLSLGKWIPKFCFDIGYLKNRIRFGLFFQGSQISNTIRDLFIPMVLGYHFGPTIVGYITWSLSFAVYPTILLNILARFYLPLFSRLQHSKESLSNALNQSIIWTNRISAPMFVFIFFFASPLISLIFTDKWLPALLLVKLLIVSNIPVATIHPIYELINSIGKTQITFIFSVSMMLIICFFSYFLMPHFSFPSFGIAAVMANFSGLLLIKSASHLVNYKFLQKTIATWVIAILIGVTLLAISIFAKINSIFDIIIFGLGFTSLYLILTWSLNKNDFRIINPKYF